MKNLTKEVTARALEETVFYIAVMVLVFVVAVVLFVFGVNTELSVG